MTTRYDAVAARKWTNSSGEEQTSYTNIGVAWPFKDKDGFTLRLHAMPAPVEGEYTVLLFPPKPREDRDQSDAPRQRMSADKANRHIPQQAPAFDDSDVPF
jgi:hypothetical protein